MTVKAEIQWTDGTTRHIGTVYPGYPGNFPIIGREFPASRQISGPTRFVKRDVNAGTLSVADT